MYESRPPVAGAGRGLLRKRLILADNNDMELSNGPVREAQLRAKTLMGMFRAGSGPVLLIGEMEGLLARRIERETGVAVTWVEPSASGYGAQDGAAAGGTSCAGAGVRLVADCCSLPFDDGSFDNLASQFALEQLEEPARALAEWRRVLKKSGAMALVTRNGLYRGPDLPPSPRRKNTFSPPGLRGLCESAGLAVTGVTTLLPDLKLPALYRGDLDFSRHLARMPYFASRGKLLFVSAVPRVGGCPA